MYKVKKVRDEPGEMFENPILISHVFSKLYFFLERERRVALSLSFLALFISPGSTPRFLRPIYSIKMLPSHSKNPFYTEKRVDGKNSLM